MSRVSYKIHDLRNDVAHCCPLCAKPWQPPEDLQMYHGLIFWKGKEVIVSPLVYNCFALFLKRLGRPVTTDELHYFIYGNRKDGGPDAQIINVSVSKLRRALRESRIPFVIHCVHKGHFSPSHFIMTEVLLDGRNNPPQRPKIVHSR